MSGLYLHTRVGRSRVSFGGGLFGSLLTAMVLMVWWSVVICWDLCVLMAVVCYRLGVWSVRGVQRLVGYSTHSSGPHPGPRITYPPR